MFTRRSGKPEKSAVKDLNDSSVFPERYRRGQLLSDANEALLQLTLFPQYQILQTPLHVYAQSPQPEPSPPQRCQLSKIQSTNATDMNTVIFRKEVKTTHVEKEACINYFLLFTGCLKSIVKRSVC